MNGLNSKSPILQITVECGDGYYRKCLTHSNEYLIQNPICPGLKDEVQDVLDTFDKMVYCYAKGIKDPKWQKYMRALNLSVVIWYIIFRCMKPFRMILCLRLLMIAVRL